MRDDTTLTKAQRLIRAATGEDYQLSDGRSFSEATLEPTSDRVLPTTITERIVRRISDHRGVGLYRLESGWACANGIMHLDVETSTRPGIGAKVTITAPVGSDGLVEAIGPFSWSVWRERGESGRWHTVAGTGENLGDAIVSVVNTLTTSPPPLGLPCKEATMETATYVAQILGRLDSLEANGRKDSPEYRDLWAAFLDLVASRI